MRSAATAILFILSVEILRCQVQLQSAALQSCSFPWTYPPTNSEVISYKANIIGSGGQLSDLELASVDAFVGSAKLHGYWTNILDCGPMAGSNTNAAVIKLVSHPVSQRTTLQMLGSPGYTTNKGFWLTNGAYLWPGLVLSNSVINVTNNGACIWISKYLTNSKAWFYGGNVASSQRNHQDGGSFDGYFQWEATIGGDGTTTYSGSPLAISEGMLTHTRTTSNSCGVFINGRSVLTITNDISLTVDGANSGTVWGIGGRYNGVPPPGTAADPKSDIVIGFYAMDNGIPASMQTNYYNDVRALMLALGRTPTRTDRRLGIVVTGQSNSYGAGGNSHSNLVTSPFDNLIGGSASQWWYADNTNNPTLRTLGCEYGSYSSWSAMSDMLSYLSTNAGLATTYNTVWESFGQNGINIGQYSSGTAPYNASTNWALAQNSIEQELCGDKLLFPAVIVVGGESDGGNANYGLNLAQLRGHYQTDLGAVNGDTNAVRIYFFQHNFFAQGQTTPENIGMLTNHVDSVGLGRLVGPRYQYSYTADMTHQDNLGNMRMGEQAARAIFTSLTNGHWEPLRPLSTILTNGNQVSCTFTGLYSSLVLDTNSFWWLTNKANYGFTYSDSGGAQISSVALESTNKVLITLDGNVSGNTARTLTYAINSTTNVSGACGTTNSPGGNLRDDCPMLGFRSTSNLWNWCVIFSNPVP